MLKYQLDKCVWELTLACCFSCKYCGSRGGKPRENELDTTECLDIVRQLACLGLRRISLIGGEVFLRKDWDQIAKAFVEYGISTNIITNGFIFSDKIIARIKEIGIDDISVSLDSLEDLHDKYRQKGSFARATKAIETLLANDIPVSVISTINAENVQHLEEFYDFLKQYKIFAWQLQACSPMGNASDGVNYEFDHSIVVDFVTKHCKEENFSIILADNIGYFSDYEGYLRGITSGTDFFRGCSAGISVIGINSIGEVRGCESLYDERFNEGSLREKTLKEIWEDPNAFAYNRKFEPSLLTGKCKNCELGFMCAGGCRSYNYFTHGKMHEAKYCVKQVNYDEI